LASITHFLGGYENNENRLFYFDLRIVLPIQSQLLYIENPKKKQSPTVENFRFRIFAKICFHLSRKKSKEKLRKSLRKLTREIEIK
jgi:hypothetical protein